MWFLTFIDSISEAGSQFLKNANVTCLNESAVIIRCEFKDGMERASCVLVYREYGNKTLVVTSTNLTVTVLPVNLTGYDPEKYTFAIFGKNNLTMDKRPIFAGRAQRTTPSTTTPTTSGKLSPNWLVC